MPAFEPPDDHKIFSWPVGSFLIPPAGEFGPRPTGVPEQFAPHDGVDLNAEEGTPVMACASGRVTKVVLESDEMSDGAGNAVWLSHLDGRMQSSVSHLRDAPLVAEGDEVTPETVLGHVGQSGNASGPHACFQVLIEGVPFNPRQILRDYGRP